MKVTIYDVAKKAGVSISTASKALNDRKDVGDRTKQLIRDIAKELNYEPSHFARALAMRKTENIGVLTGRFYGTPVLTNPFYSRIIEGIEEQLIRSNLNLITNVLRKEQIESFEVPKMVKEKNVDGIILLGYMPSEFVEMVAGKGLPVVVVDNYVNCRNCCSIVVDDVAGGYEAVKKMTETGHRRIAYIANSRKRESFRRREEGYRKALAEAGLEARDEMVIYNENEESGLEWIKKLLEISPRPDAVFACNDITAIFVINVMKENGITVPDDISVMGFDNIEMGQHFIPSISTVDIDKEKMGMKAVDLLLERVNNKSLRPENITFPTLPILRASVKSR